MKSHSRWKLGTSVLAFLAASLAQAQTYYIAHITTLDIGQLGSPLWDAGATDINNRGEIVGWSKDATVIRRPFIYRAGVMMDLGTPTTSARAVALGINDASEVVGAWGDPDEFNWQAFFWNSTGGVVTLKRSLYPGLPFDFAYVAQAAAINKGGEIAGSVESRGASSIIPSTPCFRSLPVRWANEFAAAQILHCPMVGALGTYSSDINNSGQIVGTDTNGSDPDRGWVWKLGITTFVPAPFFGAEVNALGINEPGVVVGSARLLGVATRAVRWDGVSGSSSWLPVLSGGTYSYATEINDQDFISGSADIPVAGGTTRGRAFIYHPNFGMVALPVPAGMATATTSCDGNALNNRRVATGIIEVVGTCNSHAIRWTVQVLVRPAVGVGG